MDCPVCKGKMIRRKAAFNFGNIKLGEFDADVCEKCCEPFFTEEASDEIDRKARQMGFWGMASKTRIGYSGNSLIVRIPKDISNFMKLKKGEEVSIHPEGKDKLVIELKE
jgi:hypothetical protein